MEWSGDFPFHTMIGWNGRDMVCVLAAIGTVTGSTEVQVKSKLDRQDGQVWSGNDPDLIRPDLDGRTCEGVGGAGRDGFR